jgi:pimeloyl-ACP methyl ester carboxylesterase
MPGTAPELPPVRVPTLGIGSTNDHHLDGGRMEKPGAYVEAPWRCEVIEGASHWIPLDAPDRLNALLLDWLHGPATAG